MIVMEVSELMEAIYLSTYRTKSASGRVFLYIGSPKGQLVKALPISSTN